MLPREKSTMMSLSNFDLNYSYTQTAQSSPIVDENKVTKQRGGLGIPITRNLHLYFRLKK